MECPECSKSYQEQVCEPFILIGCGHSLCHDCLQFQIANYRLKESQNSKQSSDTCTVSCPECQTETKADSLMSFPKNYSLLNMIKSSLTARSSNVHREQLADQASLTEYNGLRSNRVTSGPKDKEQYPQASDSNIQMQSISDYQSTINYNKDNRDNYLEGLDLIDQVSHSQGGQGHQAGTNLYQNSEQNQNSRLNQDQMSAVRTINRQDIENDTLSVQLNKIKDNKLILSQQSSSVEANHNENKLAKDTDDIEPNSEVSRANKDESQSQYVCETHNKGIQGYCETDRMVLCIDCILSGDHKNHEICSVDKAAKQERDALTLKFQKSQVLQSQLEGQLAKAKNHQESLQNQTVEFRNKIQQIYQEVRLLIDEKERTVISEMEQKLQKELKYISNREKDAHNQLNLIETFQSSWNKLGELTDEQLLLDINESHKEAEKALNEQKPIKTNNVIPKVNKDTEVASLTKFLLNSANSVNLPLSNPIGLPLANNQMISTTPEVHSSKFKEIEKEQTYQAHESKKDLNKRFTQRRDSGVKQQNLQRQATQTQRSSSTRPNNINQMNDAQSTLTGPSLIQKANYMQATSSWAKRKHEQEKQKEEFYSKKISERNKYQNPKGFTTLVGGQQHQQNTQGEWTSKNRDMNSTNLARNQRLTSKDHKIHNPFDRQHSNLVEKQQNNQTSLNQLNANGQYNSASKLTGSPTNTSQTNQEFNAAILKVNSSKYSKPESAEKKKKSKPAPIPHLNNQNQSVHKKDHKHSLNFNNQSVSKATLNQADQSHTNMNLSSTQSQGMITNQASQFQTINQKSSIPNYSVQKHEKLPFLKQKQRQPVLKESRANNNSRLGLDSNEKDHGSHLNKTHAQMTQRNRSQSRIDDKHDVLSDRQNNGAATVPVPSNQSRKKQNWLRSNTNHAYNFEQSSEQPKKQKLKKHAVNNQSIDVENSSPDIHSQQMNLNSFQKAALEKKRQAEVDLIMNTVETNLNLQAPSQISEEQDQFLINFKQQSSNHLNSLNSLAERRNQMKNTNQPPINDLKEPQFKITMADNLQENMDSEIKQLQMLLKEQSELASGFNDTQYARQINSVKDSDQVHQLDLAESELDQQLRHFSNQQSLDEPTNIKNQIPDLNSVIDQIKQQIDTGAQTNKNQMLEKQDDKIGNILQDLKQNQQLKSITSERNNLDGQERSNSNYVHQENYQQIQTSKVPDQVNEIESRQNQSQNQNDKQESGHTLNQQQDTIDDQYNLPRQPRQRWSTIKKNKTNEETSTDNRCQSLSQVFIDDSQDHGHLNQIIPHNDTQYSIAEDQINIQSNAHPQTSQAVGSQNAMNLPTNYDSKQQLDIKQSEINSKFGESSVFSQSIDQSNLNQEYAEHLSSRQFDKYLQSKQLNSGTQDYSHQIQLKQTMDSNDQKQMQILGQGNLQHSVQSLNQVTPQKQLNQQMLQQAKQEGYVAQEDYQSECQTRNDQSDSQQLCNRIQKPHSFMSKYQAQVNEQQKQNSGFKKRGDLDDSHIRPELTLSEQQPQDLLQRNLDGNQVNNTSGMYSIYAISGYCDQPLSAVERITFRMDQSQSQYSISNPHSQRERLNMDIQSEDEQQIVAGAKDQRVWQQCAQLNVARTKFEAIIIPENRQAGRIKQQIWILGGKNAQSQRIDVIEMYDEVTDAWNIIPQIKMRKAKSGFASVLVHNKIKDVDQLMVIGGNDGQVQNRVEFMNLWDYQWHKCASMISRRDELAACLGPDGKIYAIGGYGGPTNSSCLKSVERYDVSKNKWEQVAPMNEGRRALAAVSMPDGIYAIGGYNGKDYISSVEKYDVQLDSWQVVCHLNSPKCTMTAVGSPDQTKFYVIGGFNGTQLNEVEVYNTSTKTLRKFSYPMQHKRFMHSSAVLQH